MSWVHPWAMVAGVALAGMPVAIHFLTRPRPAAHPLSTLRFVSELLKQRAARSRLRDALILACRTLLILLIAAAIARPKFGSELAMGQENAGDIQRVVMLDISQSMGAREGGVQLLERARSKANSYLHYQQGLHANLILAAATAKPEFEQLSTNFDALQEAVRKAQVLPQRLDVRAVMEAAARQLGKESSGGQIRRELVLVSDFQRRNWSSADFASLPADVKVELVATASSSSLSNLSIVRAECTGRAVVGRSMLMEVDVANYTANDRDAGVDVSVGDIALHLQGRCGPQRITTLSGEFAMQKPGWMWGQAKLTGNDDALPADDVRPLVLQVRPQPFYALITRQADAEHNSSSFLLECALVPDAALKERAAARLKRISPQAIDRETLAATDLIAVDHPGKLDDVSLRLLVNLMRRGKTVLYVTAEPVDAINLKLMADIGSRSWQLPVEFSAPLPEHVRKKIALGKFRRDSSAFKIFGEKLDSAVAGLRFSGGLNSRRLETGLADDILASYGDDSAAMVASGVGAGNLLVINADLAESNLAASEVFVPLLEELLQQTLSRRRQATSVVSGELLDIQLPPEVGAANGLKVVSNDAEAAGQLALGKLADDGAGIRWTMAAAPPPGVFRVNRGSDTLFAVASGLSADEAQLDYLSKDVLVDRLSAGRSMHYQATGDSDPDADRDWTWLCVGGVLSALVELGLHLVFRS